MSLKLLAALAACAVWAPALVSILSRRSTRGVWSWVAAALGGIALLLTLAVQPSLQIAYGRAALSILPDAPEAALGVGTVAISGLVQEILKLAGVVLALRVAAARHGRAPSPVALGAAAGAGFGFIEAAWLFALVAPAAPGWIAIWERLSAIGFHAGASSIAGFGIAAGRPAGFYLAAAGLHAALNYLVVLRHLWVLTTIQMEIAATVVALGSLAWAWRLASKEGSQ